MHIGKIAGQAYFSEEFPAYKTVRKTEWLYHFPSDCVSESAYREANSAMSFFRIDENVEEYKKLLDEKPLYKSDLFNYVATAKDINADEYDGIYAIVQNVVKAYYGVDENILDVCDLDAIYLSSIGTWKVSYEIKKQKIGQSHLPQDRKQALYDLIDEVKKNAEEKKYVSRGNGHVGMFGTGFMSFKNNFTDEESLLSLRDFIKMLVSVATYEGDETSLINQVKKTTAKPVKGIKAGTLSGLLYCLRPTVFPIINGRYGMGASVYYALGIGLTEPNATETYADNVFLIKDFRDRFCVFKNYRILDMVPEELYKKKSDAEENTEVNESVETSEVKTETVDEYGEEMKEGYSEEDFLNEVFMDADRYETLVALLKNKKNVILQGVPGVGKTFAAKRLAYSLMRKKDETKIGFVQFHQNYSYEDFIMGYKPEGDTFVLKTGVFYDFCKKAEKDPESDYFFIIDEINRGNISKIFGELLLLIEKGYRGKENAIRLTYGKEGETFSVPENLYIIGMMNTADRSIAIIDYALRRRFGFFEMLPAFNNEGFIRYQQSLDSRKFDALIEKIKKLNEAITADEALGSGFCIGHSYFCGWQNDSNDSDSIDEWLKRSVEFDVIPMLSEYWFDDKTKVDNWAEELLGVTNGR
ncbi:MAG: AAA family ATPase [Clostridia bacterium]|nr:AAA family ATPase [Clostridia bacterium]